MIGKIFNIQHFSVHDGDGIRTTVFMKGCNLRCKWCHNPEGIHGGNEIQFFANKCIGCRACVKVCPLVENGKTALFTDRCTGCGKCASECYAEALLGVGEDTDTEKLMEEIEKDRSMYENSGGGVTFSGGEPLLQAEFVLEMLKKCKAAGINTSIETAACLPYSTIESVLPFLDSVFCDIKSADEKRHIEGTGQSNALILENIRKLNESGVQLLLRTPIVPGYNDDEHSMEQIADFILSLKNKQSIELLAFHGAGTGKYNSLSRSYIYANAKSPSKEKMSKLLYVLRKRGINAIYEKENENG